MRRAALVAVALAGTGCLVAGVGLRTVWLPDEEVRAVASLAADVPVAITAPGVLEALPGPVTVRATAAGGGPVLLAVGRQGDVQAWVGDAPQAVVTGFGTETSLVVEVLAGGPAQPPRPDPAGSDLWVQRDVGAGTAALEYRPGPGAFLLLVAADGAANVPGTLTLTWSREVGAPWSLPLLLAGLVLVVIAVAAGSTRPARAEPAARPS